MKTDEELLKTFKIERQENIIYIEITESETEEDNNGRQAELLSDGIAKVVAGGAGTSFDFLIDLTLAGTVSYISPKAREVYTNLPKISKFNKAAIVGHNLMLEVAVNLLMQATGRSQSFKWFGDKEEARVWLKTN